MAAREQAIGSGGIYPGSELAFVFQTLRANDLIWRYVVKNDLKGESPEAFDLLYWNADSTNLLGPMYCWYLRNMYLENRLRMPGRLSMCGVAVDIGKVDMPAYVLATQEDHIVPWRSAFESVELLGGEAQSVLGASGHVAGVITPASRNRRSYWIDGTADAGAIDPRRCAAHLDADRLPSLVRRTEPPAAGQSFNARPFDMLVVDEAHTGRGLDGAVAAIRSAPG